MDPSNWDFRRLLYYSDNLAKDVKREEQELKQLLNKGPQG